MDLDKIKEKSLTKTWHIIFDAFGVERDILNSDKFIFELLDEVPKLIGMKILSGPNMVRDYDKLNPGVSAFAIIDFSHISIHTFTKTREVLMDIFSCRKFDYEKIRKYLYNKFKVRPEQVETLEVKYPWEK
ncbi:MAG: S-adenosylmethionine decarboxylase [bacterium]|nr:S-adenosylmethionine decarboxylase [bacterium]